MSQDVDILKNVTRRLDSNDASNVDQLLPDFYAEHVTLAMNRERRKQSLVRVLHLIRQDLERERRGREGLETLHRAFIQTPAFAADESTQNVTEKLHHVSWETFFLCRLYDIIVYGCIVVILPCRLVWRRCAQCLRFWKLRGTKSVVRSRKSKEEREENILWRNTYWFLGTNRAFNRVFSRYVS